MIAEPLAESDFGHAVVQVLCLLYEREYHLVFAAAELLPKEVPQPPREPILSIPARRMGGQARLFYARYLTTASEALAWYEQCRQGNFKLMQDEAELATRCDPLLSEPEWPQLVAGSKLPLWGDVPSSARAHHLYPVTTPAVVARLFETEPDLQKWASDRIFASFSRFPELAGSAHLLVPNPVFRNLQVRLHVQDDGRESTAIELSPRAGMSPRGLEALVIEHRPTGICSLQTKTFEDAPHMLVPHLGAAEEVELFIRCPQRGVLEWQRPSSYVRGFSLEGSIVSARKRVVVPPTASAAPGSTPVSYDVQVASRGWVSHHREPGGPSEIPARLRSIEFERRRNDEAERLGQKWFHGSRAEATDFVRSLIGQARERVWIIDPYFATAELFSFALATAYSDVEVVVATSAHILQKSDLIAPPDEAGDVLLRGMQGRREFGHIRALVMTGDMPTVHDRFLVIDSSVWFTGNSLNSIGERAGMMIKLPAPDVVIRELTKVLDDTERTKPLDVWVAARQASRTATP